MSGWSKKTMQNMIIAELGGSTSPTDAAVVNVELTDEQYNVAFIRTQAWFNSKKGYVIWRPIQANPAVPEYKMKADVVDVLDVSFETPTDVAAFYSLGFFDLIPYGPQSIGSLSANTASYSGFMQLLQYNKNRKQVFSVDNDWFYQKQTKILNLNLRTDLLSSIIMVQCKIDNYDVATLDGWDRDLFYRHLLARCKIIVGRIRSKYDQMPTAGGTVGLDGKELIAEAEKELEQIDKELYASAGTDLPVVG